MMRVFSYILSFIISTNCIRLGGIFSLKDKKGNILEKGLQRLEAFKFAISEVNKKYGTDISYQTYDDESSITKGLVSAVNAVNNGIDIIIGPASSSITEPVAYLCAGLKLPIVSYASSSTSLSDISKFPTLMRTIASDISQASAFSKLIEKAKWEVIALVGTEDLYGAGGVEEISKKIQQNVVISCNFIISSKNQEKDIVDLAGCIKSSKTKVIVLFMNEISSSLIITRLRERSVISDDTILLASDSWASSDFIDYGLKNVKGFKQDFVKNTIGVIQSPGDISWFSEYFNSLTPENNNYPEFIKYWENTFDCKINSTCKGDEKLNTRPNPKIPFVYDAVEIVAIAIDILKNNYTNLDIEETIRKNTMSTKSGEVIIKGVDRIDISFDYILYNGENWVNIGVFSKNNTDIDLSKVFIPDSNIKNIYIEYNSLLSIITICILVIDFLCAFAILIYFYTRSSDAQVKLYSLLFSSLTVGGLCLTWVSLFMWLGEASAFKCGLLKWGLYMGTSLIIAVLISKNYRLVKIYNERSLHGTILGDRDILIFVAIICGIQFIILISGAFYGYSPVLNISTRDPLVRYNSCTNSPVTEWVSIGYTAILVFVGVLISFLTRNVPIKFNESKYIAFCMYSIFLNVLMLLPTRLIDFKDVINGYYIQNILNISILLFGSNTVFIILFFSRVVVVYNRQKSLHNNEASKEKTEEVKEDEDPDVIEVPDIQECEI